MAIAEVLRALNDMGLKRSGAGWIARCPAHEDRVASLSINEGDKGAVVFCQAGCQTAVVVERLGLRMSDLFAGEQHEDGPDQIVSTFDYRDEKGVLLYQAVRKFPKKFSQRRPDGSGGWHWNLQGTRRVLYRLAELIAADPTKPACVVEGEKDVDNLREIGFIATTNVGGAGKWKDDYSNVLRGRDVVVLPDNDPPGKAHGAQVAKSLEGVARSCRVIDLPGLGPKGDVSDWLKAGGTAEKLTALIAGAAPAPVASFRVSADRLAGERAERIDLGAQSLTFGVQFLDDALGGITSRDVVLLGAPTGVGKTELATAIARHNCMRGKKVHYFALEAEDREIERRMKFRIISEAYHRDGFHRPPIRYLDWYMGRLDRELARFEEAADRTLDVALSNLQTFYRLDSFTSDDFCKHLEAIKSDTDLVILDHLHYVDTDDENENRGYKRTVKQIRDAALRAGKPTIVVAHVRKGDRRYAPAIPTIEDFHGSSDIPKMSTKAIMLAPAYDMVNPQPHMWGTFIQVSKCRLDNSVTRYVALAMFNARMNAYEHGYVLGKLTEGGKTFAPLSLNAMPDWATLPRGDDDDVLP